MNTQYVVRVATTLTMGIALAACGALLTPSGTVTPPAPANSTLESLLRNGLPAFSSLAPSLPEAFSRGSGVETDDRGSPMALRALETGLLADALGQGQVSSVIAEATALSRESMALARLADLSARSLAEPLFDLLRAPELYTSLLNVPDASGLPRIPGWPQALSDISPLKSTEAKTSPGTHGLFRYLLGQGQASVRLPAIDNPLVPAALLLSAPKGGEGLEIKPLWKQPDGSYRTHAALNISAADDNFRMDLAFSPADLSGLLPTFPQALGQQLCSTGTVHVSLARNTTQSVLSVTESTCPTDAARNRQGGFQIARSADGALSLAGSFRAPQEIGVPGGLRSSFGARPLFAFRAHQAAKAADAEGSSLVIADALALPESQIAQAETATSEQELFRSFGLSQVLSSYAVRAFWDSAYGSSAVRTVLCGIGGSVDADLQAFCDARVGGDTARDAFAAVTSAARSSRQALQFVTDADGLIAGLEGLESLLAIRNSMALSPEAAPLYGQSFPESGDADVLRWATDTQTVWEPVTLSEEELKSAALLNTDRLFAQAAQAACDGFFTSALHSAGKMGHASGSDDSVSDNQASRRFCP